MNVLDTLTRRRERAETLADGYGVQAIGGGRIAYLTKRAGVLTGKDVDQQKMAVRSVITVEVDDRSGDVVVTDGIVTDHHAANPVVLYNHGQLLDKPIGQARDPDGMYTVERESNLLRATTYFSQTLPAAYELFGLVAEGILNGWSIGAVPIDLEYRDVFGPAANEGGLLVKSCELFEYSLTPTPDCRQALTDRVMKATTGGKTLPHVLLKALMPAMLPQSVRVSLNGAGFRKVKDASGHEHAADGKFGTGGSSSKKDDDKETTGKDTDGKKESKPAKSSAEHHGEVGLQIAEQLLSGEGDAGEARDQIEQWAADFAHDLEMTTDDESDAVVTELSEEYGDAVLNSPDGDTAYEDYQGEKTYFNNALAEKAEELRNDVAVLAEVEQGERDDIEVADAREQVKASIAAYQEEAETHAKYMKRVHDDYKKGIESVNDAYTHTAGQKAEELNGDLYEDDPEGAASDAEAMNAELAEAGNPYRVTNEGGDEWYTYIPEPEPDAEPVKKSRRLRKVKDSSGHEHAADGKFGTGGSSSGGDNDAEYGELNDKLEDAPEETKKFARRLYDAVRKASYDVAIKVFENSHNLAPAILDTAEDFNRISYDKASDAILQSTGVSANVALLVASHALAKIATLAKRRLSKSAPTEADYNAAVDGILDILAAQAEALGVELELPSPDEVLGKLKSNIAKSDQSEESTEGDNDMTKTIDRPIAKARVKKADDPKDKADEYEDLDDDKKDDVKTEKAVGTDDKVDERNGPPEQDNVSKAESPKTEVDDVDGSPETDNDPYADYPHGAATVMGYYDRAVEMAAYGESMARKQENPKIADFVTETASMIEERCEAMKGLWKEQYGDLDAPEGLAQKKRKRKSTGSDDQPVDEKDGPPEEDDVSKTLPPALKDHIRLYRKSILATAGGSPLQAELAKAKENNEKLAAALRKQLDLNDRLKRDLATARRGR